MLRELVLAESLQFTNETNGLADRYIDRLACFAEVLVTAKYAYVLAAVYQALGRMLYARIPILIQANARVRHR